MNILLVVCPPYSEMEKLLKAAEKISSALAARLIALCVSSGLSQKYYSPFSIQLGKLDRGEERKVFEDVDRVLGSRVVKMSRSGELATQVLEEVEKGDYGMLLFGDADKNLTKKMAEHSPIPTFIFRRGGELGKFLVCSDGSEHSLRAARFAGKLAKSLHAKLTLLSVAKRDEERPIADEAINRAKAALGEISVSDVEAEVRISGSVRNAILDEEKSYDVVALSPRGLSKIERVLLGHVSLHVLEKAESSVLLVR